MGLSRAPRWRSMLTPEALTKYVPAILLPVLFIVGILTIDGFATRGAITNLLILASLFGIASIGQTIAIIVGGLDLSVAGVIGLANVLIILLYGQGWNFWLAAGLIVVIAAVIGAVNAAASILLNVHPIITTLGTGMIILGEVLAWGRANVQGAVPDWLVEAVSVTGSTGPIPIPGIIIVWAVLAAIMIFVQHRTRLGEEIYATGSNKTGARLAHVRTRFVWVFAFMLSSVSAAIVGILFAGYIGTADANVGGPYMFLTITAVCIGGTALLGGQGGYGRTVIGVLIIVELQMLLMGIGMPAALQQCLLGVLIIVLVAIYGRENHISARI